MTEITSITKIIQKKVKSFTKEKFIDIFENLLQDYVNYNPITNVINNSNLKFNNQYPLIKKVNALENKKLMRTKCIWHFIASFALKNDKKYHMPSLIISYLNLKISIIMQRLLYISSKYNYSITFVSRKYIDICRYEIQKMKLLRKNSQNQILKQASCFTKLNNNKKGGIVPLTERLHQKSSKKVSFVPMIEDKNNQHFIETQYELEDHKKEEDSNLNLFIGNFNINKFKDHNQTVYLKKYDNISTFIFVNKEDANDPKIKNNPDNRRLKSRNGGKAQIVSMPKIFGKKGAMNIHRFNSFQFIDNEMNEINHDNKQSKVKHNNILTTYINNNDLLHNRKSSAKLKHLSIKIPISGNLTNRTVNNLNHNNCSRNKNVNSSYYCYSEELINKNIDMNFFKKRNCKIKNTCNLKSTTNVINHNVSRKYNEQSMLLSYDNSSPSKKKYKTRNKIKLMNFFSKTDLYY